MAHYPWLEGTIAGCSTRRHGRRWCLVDSLLEHCCVCHPPADGLVAVDADTRQALPASAYASHHTVESHLSITRSTT